MLTFRKGDDVFVDPPYATAIDKDRLADTCNWCFSHPITSEIQCPSCSVVTYCSTKCLEKDTTFHKLECLYLRKRPEDPYRLRRITSRALARFLDEREKNSPAVQYFFEHRRTIHDLLTHEDEFQPERVQYFKACSEEIAKFLAENGHIVEEDLIMSIIQKIVINAHEVRDYSEIVGKSLGETLYLAGSKMDHTCEIPDHVMTMFIGNRIVIKALKDFSIPNSLDVRGHYIPIVYERKARQEMLKTRYYFDCECTRCVEEAGENRTVISLLLEDLLLKPVNSALLQKLKTVESKLSEIEVSKSLKGRLLRTIFRYSPRESLERSRSLGLAACESYGPPLERMVLLYFLCVDMAHFGANQPSHEYYSEFKTYHEKVLNFFAYFGYEKLTDSMARLDASTREWLFLFGADDQANKQNPEQSETKS